MNKPLFKNSEFTDILPFEMWKQAYKQAERSTLDSFRTGAIIFDQNLNVIGRGCSHHSEWTAVTSVHAEDHALKESKHDRTEGFYSILILTIGKAGNPTYSSRPCSRCAYQLNGEINLVYYPERLNDGSWIVNCETPYSLVERIEDSDANCKYYNAVFAKDMRIA